MKSDTLHGPSAIMGSQPKWMGTLIWIAAHLEFAMAEVIALHASLKSYGRDHSLLFAIVVPLLAIMPWMMGIAAVRKFKHIEGSKLDEEVRHDVSRDIGSILLFSYLLFIIGLTVTT
jgi:tetrahydromethanopterin S-methyltransferase subunit G